MNHPSIKLILLWLAPVILLAQPEPTFEAIQSLRSVSSPVVSPDGTTVIYQERAVDWANNRYDTELWLARAGEVPFQLTNNPQGSSTSAQWSPDGNWIAYLTATGDHRQIHIMRAAGGATFEYTRAKGGVNAFEWSPDGRQLAFLQAEDQEAAQKARTDAFGAFAVDDEEYQQQQLWIVDFRPEILFTTPLPSSPQDSSLKALRAGSLLLDTVGFTITNFQWSPDGRHIAFTHQPNPLINSFLQSDISLVEVETGTYRPLIQNRSTDSFGDWSPDGKSIVYSTNLDNTASNFYVNDHYFRIDLDGTNQQALAADFDEGLSGLTWTSRGIYATAWQRTKRRLVRIDPNSGTTELLNLGVDRIYAFSTLPDGSQLTFQGNRDTELTEIFRARLPEGRSQRVTNTNTQIADWTVPQNELIQWESEDGATIEGVLSKPADFDPNKKYPLLVVIHGGPTGISTPSPIPSTLYPIVDWVNKGALVLQPNYRGSAGYGEAFRSLNVRNLGVGDAWDVLSGVAHLEAQGIVDSERVGAMGWSQGGYISAFLTTNSTTFKAISVGAGISNWMTYYVNTDIHPFTRQYLKATPWSDPEIYAKTSPMTTIKQASTPTLIQHGEFDRRVPIANAYELVQGLRDVGVPSKLVVYKGFGHGINKPKERLAAMWHNWQWFGKYLWGEKIELPK